MSYEKSKTKRVSNKRRKERINSDLNRILMNREVCLILRDPVLETIQEVRGIYRGIYRFNGLYGYRIALDELTDDQKLTLRRHHYPEDDIKDIIIEGGYRS